MTIQEVNYSIRHFAFPGRVGHHKYMYRRNSVTVSKNTIAFAPENLMFGTNMHNQLTG